MNKFSFDQGDDLSDIFGEPGQSTAPKALPQHEQLVRIRETVPVFEEICKKCGGTGRFGSWRYVGPCFACKGKGKHTFKTSPEQRQRNRDGAAQRKVDKARENWEAFKANRPQHAAWIEAFLAKSHGPNSERFAEMIASLRDGVVRYGDLTVGQLGVVERAMQRDAEREERRQEARRQAVQSQQQAPGVDASKILEAIQKAREAGHNEIFLRFQGVVIFEAKKYPGTLYVKSGKRYEDTYFGKIVEGRFLASRDCPADMVARIVEIAGDPANAARVYGHTSGACSCCGRRLDDPASVARGIGPICAAKFGF